MCSRIYFILGTFLLGGRKHVTKSCVNVVSTNLVSDDYRYYDSFQRLTCPDLYHMIKQHYGQDLGLTHEEMESLQMPTESSMHAR